MPLSILREVAIAISFGNRGVSNLEASVFSRYRSGPDAAFQQKGADLIDDAGALPDQSLAHAVKGLQIKLLGGLGVELV
jgi:hypothetical protein